jgi:hypothetical protein
MAKKKKTPVKKKRTHPTLAQRLNSGKIPKDARKEMTEKMKKNPGAFKEGNEIWKLATYSGRERLYTPEELLATAKKYFVWCAEHPLYEHKAMQEKGKIKIVKIPKLRVFTYEGLTLFLGVNSNYIQQFRKTDTGEYSWVLAFIDSTIYSQKFESAAADLLNANIIARDLGLVDRSETKVQDDLRLKVGKAFPDESELPVE